MPQFTDSKDRKWDVVVNVSNAKRVRDVLGVPVLELYDPKVAADVFADPIKLVDVLYVLCQPQADARDIDDAGFGEAMVGDSLDGAADALLEAVAAFFPRAERETKNRIHAQAKKAAALIHKHDDLVLTQLEGSMSLPSASSSRAQSA